MDQFVDELLTKERVCATSLWKLPSRQQLEDLNLLEERISPLGAEIDEIDAEGAEDDGALSESTDDHEDARGNARDEAQRESNEPDD